MRWAETYGQKKAQAAARALTEGIASLRVHGDREELERKYVARNAA